MKKLAILVVLFAAAGICRAQTSNPVAATVNTEIGIVDSPTIYFTQGMSYGLALGWAAWGGLPDYCVTSAGCDPTVSLNIPGVSLTWDGTETTNLIDGTPGYDLLLSAAPTTPLVFDSAEDGDDGVAITWTAELYEATGGDLGTTGIVWSPFLSMDGTGIANFSDMPAFLCGGVAAGETCYDNMTASLVGTATDPPLNASPESSTIALLFVGFAIGALLIESRMRRAKP